MLKHQNNNIHKYHPYIYSDRNVLSGTPCFSGTRVPVSLVIEYLSKGWGLSEVIDMYPSVRKEHVSFVLKIISNEFGINRDKKNKI